MLGDPSTTHHAPSAPEAAEASAVALVTGGARRIGRGIVLALHARGLRVLIHCRGSMAEASALAEELCARRADSARVLQADLTRTEELGRLAGEALACWGRIDVLVHNASTFYATPLNAVDDASNPTAPTPDAPWDAAWHDLIGTNLKAPLYLTRALHGELRARRGAIVHIVDIHALRPLKNYSIYCAAKAGLWSLTQSLARELGPDVRVNGVAPGAILEPENDANVGTHEAMVERTALKRPGQPQDIAGAVVFLALDAPYITGQVLPVDGGRSASQ